MNFFTRKNPKIQIKYNRFLDPIFGSFFEKRFSLSLIDARPQNEVIEIINDYRRCWRKDEKKVLNFISKITELSFKRNFVDVHVVRLINRSFSRPIIFDIRKTPEDFCDNLTHELLHILFSDNKKVISCKLENWLKSEFPEETDCTRNHIYVHSILKVLYLEVLKKPERFRNNIIRSKAHTTDEYTRAWNIVNSLGAKNLIKEIKKNYGME
tara:strand:- start:3060 stop:3692 length:633 start_codon:yes stop_codon:yes gene_type:complete